MQIHLISPVFVPASMHSKMWGNLWQQKKPRQLPWLHGIAVLQPSVLCSAFSAALLKPSTTVKHNKEQLTCKEPPLLFFYWHVMLVEDTLQLTRSATTGRLCD